MLHRRLRTPVQPVLYAGCRDPRLRLDMIGRGAGERVAQPVNQATDIEQS